MHYRFTDTDNATITVDLKLSDVASLRMILEAAAKVELEGVSKWRIREVVKALVEAQGNAAEVMAREARTLAEIAKLPDEF